jgi:hypothetical protein
MDVGVGNGAVIVEGGSGGPGLAWGGGSAVGCVVKASGHAVDN